MNTIINLWLVFFFFSTTVLTQDLGKSYSSELKKFSSSNAIKAGLIPIDEFYRIFEKTTTN